MHRSLKGMTRGIGIAFLCAAGAAEPQTVVNGPYYAEPSWDQTLPAPNRFLVLSNFNSDAVLDRETGRVWQRAAQPGAQQGAAVDGCARSKTGGRFGWRLPSIAELSSLFDPASTAVPSLPAGHPFTGLPTTHFDLWSASPYPNLAGAHYVMTNVRSDVAFYIAVTGDYDSISAPSLCVRGGAAGRD